MRNPEPRSTAKKPRATASSRLKFTPPPSSPPLPQNETPFPRDKKMKSLQLSQRLAALTDSHRECMNLISRLSKTDSAVARSELASAIHQGLKDAEQELELLAAMAEDDAIGGGAGGGVEVKIGKAVEDFKMFVSLSFERAGGVDADARAWGDSARAQYRKAQLSAKRNAEQRDREALLGTSGRSTPDANKRRGGNQKLSQNDLTLNASTDVTTALRRTHTLLQSELSRSRFASETLQSSTQALQDLSHRYSVFDDVISSSRALISDLVRKNKSDSWYYQKAVQILVGLLLWILVRRLLWVPIYLLVGLPMRGVWWCLSAAMATTTTMTALAGAHGTVASGPRHTEAVGIRETLSVPPPDDDDDVRATDSPREGDGEPSMRERVERMLYDAENTPQSTSTDHSHEQEYSPPDEENGEENVRKNPKSRSMEDDYYQDRRFENARADRYRGERDEL